MSALPPSDNLHDLYDQIERDARANLVRFVAGIFVGLAMGATLFLLGMAA